MTKLTLKEKLLSCKRALNSLQWQVTFLLCAGILFASLLILGIRIYNVFRNYISINTGTVIAGAATQLKNNPWFADWEFKAPHDGKDGSQEERPKGPPAPRIPVTIDFGSVLRDMQVDFRFFPERNMHLFYINEAREFYSMDFDLHIHRNSIDDEDINESKRELLFEKALKLTEQPANEQLIVSDEDSSYTVVPHTNKIDGSKGWLFLYMTKPSFSAMLHSLLISSLHEMLGLLFFSIFAGLGIGFIISRRWTLWFKNVATVMESWSEGDFTPRIKMETVAGVTEWIDLSDNLNDMADQLEQVVETRKILAASEERNRLARELHDNIKQQIFSISMNLGAAQMLRKKDPEKMDEKLQLAGEMTRNTLLDLDTMITTMRPMVSTNEKFYRDLSQVLNTWQKSSGIALSTEIDDARKVTDEKTAETILRVCQEALSNISRHSEAGEVSIRLFIQDLGIDLIIRDNGKGFAINQPHSGMGLHSMRERIEELKGTFTIQSNGSGTVIKAYLPLKMSI